MKIFVLLSLTLITFVCLTKGAKILGIFQMPSYSHYQMSSRLLKELAARGHEVTVISRYKEKGKISNFKTIYLTDELNTYKDIKLNTLRMNKMYLFENVINTDTAYFEYTENTLNNSNVQRLLNSNETFDIVILERLLNNALHGFCYYYQAHCVIFSPQVISRWTNVQMGNAGTPAYIPDPRSRFTDQMNFFERAYNFFTYLFAEIVFHAYILPTHNDIMHKYFPNAPYLNDIFYNISLMLVNSDISTTPPLPLLPNMIEIGGFHIEAPKVLPNDFKRILDEAKDGVVLFSMGSNLNSEVFAVQKRDAFLKAFGNLNQTILWKWDKESIPNQPLNVILSKWIPQNDVLAHPNVKLFITHGGLLSIFEAVYHGVPIIGIPVFGDQYSNMKYAEQYGYGISIPSADLTEDKLVTALNEILNNPMYMYNARARSRIMHDNQMKPLDKAMFWIEYILRHNGAAHLRSPALRLFWYQYLLLDVLAIVGITAMILFFLIYKICTKTQNSKIIKVKKNKKD